MKSNAKKIFAILTVILSVIAFLTAYYYMGKNNLDASHSYRLNKGWKITVDGKNYMDADIDVLVPKQQKNRSEIRMDLVMPDAGIKNPVLKFYTIHSAYEIYMDNDLLEHYGMWEASKNRMVGYGISYINLPDDYVGRTLKIRIYVNEDKAFTNIECPILYDEDYAYRDFIIENRLPLAINLFLLVFGFCLLPISIFFSIKNKKFFKLICVALFSMLMSLWSICSYDLITLFTYNLKVKAYLEFTMLYTCPLFVLLYFRDDIMNGRKWMKVMFYITEALQIIYLIVVFTLHALNIAHLPALITGEHLLILLICINMVSAIVYELRHNVSKKKPIVIGMIVFVFIGATDMLRFNVGKFIFTDKVFHYVSILCIGTLVFVIAQIIDFCQEISDMISDVIRQSALEEMAYKDSLTEISNRRRCEEEFVRMDESDKTYGMICFDLNNLKKTNDILGHEKGDLLIRSFAEVLNETYGEVGIPCRMGGDEFIVLFPDVTDINLRELYANLKDNIIKKNSVIEGVRITTAIGYSDNSVHKEWKSADIYREADKKMYNNKVAMKAQRT